MVPPLPFGVWPLTFAPVWILMPFLPNERPFFEPLRGFESYPLAANGVGIADVAYRYRFIIRSEEHTSELQSH